MIREAAIIAPGRVGFRPRRNARGGGCRGILARLVVIELAEKGMHAKHCSWLLLAALPALAWGVRAGGGDTFAHKDWQLACDNTRTCRAAGYQEEGGERAVSVLLTRPAGPRAAVTGQLRLGDFNEGDQAWMAALPERASVGLWIDGQRVGALALDKGLSSADLPLPLVDALLAALRRDGRIEWRSGDVAWRLSGAGASAVLLKMDEVQGRLGTPGALVRRGQRDEALVLPPLPAPVVQAAAVPEAKAGTILAPAQASAMRARLRGSAGASDDCEALAVATAGDVANTDADAEAITAWPLSSTQQLVEARCWRAIYNVGYGYWVVADGQAPVQVTDIGSEYDGNGTITSVQKGRGLFDCGWSETWTWDGRAFVHTDSSGDGMCRTVSIAGAWALPTWVAEVRPPAHRGEGAGGPVPAGGTR